MKVINKRRKLFKVCKHALAVSNTNSVELFSRIN